jgi:hypothetical protein
MNCKRRKQLWVIAAISHITREISSVTLKLVEASPSSRKLGSHFGPSLLVWRLAIHPRRFWLIFLVSLPMTSELQLHSRLPQVKPVIELIQPVVRTPVFNYRSQALYRRRSAGIAEDRQHRFRKCRHREVPVSLSSIS